MINDLAALAAPVVLVLDDYHFITTAAIHDGLAFVLDHLPATMHVIIATRADPPLPLARLRARDQLAEIRAADLRFTPDEAAAFFRQSMQLNLSADDSAALTQHTEGWIAGVQLAALSLQNSEDPAGFVAAFAGSHRYIVDYLVEEVLDRLMRLYLAFVEYTADLPVDAILFGDDWGDQRGVILGPDRWRRKTEGPRCERDYDPCSNGHHDLSDGDLSQAFLQQDGRQRGEIYKGFQGKS